MRASQAWVAVDWGTTQLRLWGIDADDSVLGTRQVPRGMAKLKRSEYATVLEENILALGLGDECPVIVCGMAGAAQGWHEASYLDATVELSSLGRHAVRVPNLSRSVHILPGLMQRKPANVMRGEETQLLGLLHQQGGFNGVVCLPGTHTKWVEMRDGNIQRFTTHMTGEMFALLSDHSVLKHSVKRLEVGASAQNLPEKLPESLPESLPEPWSQEAFAAALNESLKQPEKTIEQLFSIRASSLLENTPTAVSRSRLSGLLVGLELAATKNLWAHQSVTLIGDPTLCMRYESALNAQGVKTECHTADSFTLAGLIDAYHQLKVMSHGN